MTKTLLPFSQGLQNMLLNPQVNKQEDFIKIVSGENSIMIHPLIADYFSRLIASRHFNDPTAVVFDFTSCKSLFTSEMLTILENIVNCKSVTLNDDLGYKLRLIAIKLDCKELYQKVDELFPFFKSQNINEEVIQYIDYICDFYHYKMFPNDYVNCDQIIERIAQNFFIIDENNLIKLPKTILFLIISNDKFRSKNEDSLFDLIIRKLDSNDEDDSFDENQLLEQIHFEYLSPNNFKIFIHRIDIMSGQLWNNIRNYMETSFHQKTEVSKRYIMEFKFDGKKENAFKGIINYLTIMSNGNVCSKNVIKITVSSLFKAANRSIEAIVDLENKETYMQFDYRIDYQKGRPFIIYDLCNFKINIEQYSMRSKNAEPKENHMMNWNIEVSNDGQNWKMIDYRTNETSLCNYMAQNTFTVKNKLDSNEFYRYVRFYQTGVDSKGEFYGCISALEFFGSIICI